MTLRTLSVCAAAALLLGACAQAVGSGPDASCLNDCTQRHPPGFCQRACTPGNPDSGVGWHGSIESGLGAQLDRRPAENNESGASIRARTEKDRGSLLLDQQQNLQDINSRLFK